MAEFFSTVSELDPEHRQNFESIVAGFREAWRGAGQPLIQDHVPADAPFRSLLIRELVRIDIEFRRRQGEAREFRDYQLEFPELGPSLAGDTANEATWATSQQSTASLPLAPNAMSRSIPDVFGRYTILKELGQGAMGAVYLARDAQLDRNVALKIPKFTGRDADGLLERFYREAKAAATLRHPNICPVFDVGEIEGQHYISMAFIDGRPLRDFTRSKKPQPERRAASLVRKLALGLAEVHALGVVHRDLKPANVMIDKKGEPVVMDFGLAHRATNEESRVTHSGEIFGTPAYMPPEQAAGDPKRIGPSTDIYSLGVILYELLTGQVPFRGDLMTVLTQIATQAPSPPSQFRPRLDSRLEAICLKMMAKQASDRYASMRAAAEALAEYLRDSKREHPQASSLPQGQSPLSTCPESFVEGDSSPSNSILPSADCSQPFETFASIRKPARRGRRRPNPRLAVAWGVALVAALSVLAAVTLSIRLGKVELKVVVNDPSLVVRIEGETVTFEGSGNPIRLRPGDHKFIVERDGAEVETDNLVLKKDGQNVLQVSLVKGSVVVSKNEGAAKIATRNAAPRLPSPGTNGWPPQAPATATAPFDTRMAREHQEAWAKHLGAPVKYTNSIGMEFQLIPPGEFTMGASPELLSQIARGDSNWRKFVYLSQGARPVTLSEAFYLAVHPTTVDEFSRFANATNYKTVAEATSLGTDGTWRAERKRFAEQGRNEPTRPDTAAVNILPVDAEEFCRWLSKIEGCCYMLPTDAQWEFAARAGNSGRWSFGDDESQATRYCWGCEGTLAEPPDVARKLQNAFGLFDMCGLIHEIVADEPSRLAATPATDPFQISEGSAYLVRGIPWIASDRRGFLAFRGMKSRPQSDVGFRVAIMGRERNWRTPADTSIASRKAWAFETDRRLGAVPPEKVRPLTDWELAYVDNTGTVRLATLDGKSIRTLPDIPTPVSFLSAQDGGRSLAVVCDRRLVKISLDGSTTPQDLYEFPSGPIGAALSPDGKRLAWRCARNGKWVLLIHDLALGGEALCLGEHYDESWTHDGKDLIFLYQQGARHGIGRWDGDKLTTIAAPFPRSLSVFPTPSPDGSVLAFGMDADDGRAQEIALISADGKRMRQVTHSGHRSTFASFSPDGSHIAFRCRSSSSETLRVVELATDIETEIDEHVNRTRPVWIQNLSGQALANSHPIKAVAPFDAKHAKKRQDAWAHHLETPVEFENSIGMKFALIPASKGLEPFYLATSEVTQAEYAKVTTLRPSWFCKSGKGADSVEKLETDDFPVEYVTFKEASRFCELLSEVEEEKSRGRIYRLPTYEEWTFACQAGVAGPYNTGDRISSTQANFDGSRPYHGLPGGRYLGRTTSVRSYPPNAFGLFDMHGNVSEYCTNPTVLRGGSWAHSYGDLQTFTNFPFGANNWNERDGLRVAISLRPKVKESN